LARCLIIGCGCRGLSLAGALSAHGHVVRGTTRDRSRLPELERAGVDAVLADPDRVATVAPALEHVVVVCVLLGSAAGEREQLAALHGTRLDMLLTRILDSTVRGILYEVTGTVDGALLEAGAGRVRAFCEDSRIPYALLEAEPSHTESWLESAAAAVRHVLGEVG
jgi:threonine dehydrogenase-like Zn-dependent dehydrogenase